MTVTAETSGALVADHDGQLVKQIATGSAAAFEELYERYCDRAYRVARAVCHDHARAEDAVQEAFISVWRSPTGYQPGRGTVAAWLLSSVRYRAIDIVRRNAKHTKRRVDEAALDAHRASGSVSDQVAASDDAARLRALLGGLPPAQQEVIVLAFYGQLTHTEIAAALDLPAGTVKGRMRLGLQKLRAGIEEQVA